MAILIGLIGAGRAEKATTLPLQSFTPWLVNFLRMTEGLRLGVYQDTPRRQSIGYGHRRVFNGPRRCTVVQAEKWLHQDIRSARRWVDVLTTVPLTQRQHDALTSFVFNVGPGTLRRSTLLKVLNEGKYDQAGRMLACYCKSRGRVCRGLKRRRFAEMRHYFSKEV